MLRLMKKNLSLALILPSLVSQMIIKEANFTRVKWRTYSYFIRSKLKESLGLDRDALRVAG